MIILTHDRSVLKEIALNEHFLTNRIISLIFRSIFDCRFNGLPDGCASSTNSIKRTVVRSTEWSVDQLTGWDCCAESN